MRDERSARLNERGVVRKTFEIGLFCAVDVQVVGIGRGDHRGIGAQVVERAIELVGLDDYEITFGREDIVRAVVFRDSAQERVAIHRALVQ